MTPEEFRAQSAAWYKRPSIFAQTNRGATKPRYARPGDRYGELTVMEDIGRTHLQDVIWKCRCDCGNFAHRTTVALNRSVRNGGSPCCSRCQEELTRGKKEEYLDRRHDQLLDLWFERRTLWSDTEVENLKVRILEDLQEQICPCREEEEMPELEPWYPIRYHDILYAQRAMKENHERAKWERESKARREREEREQAEYVLQTARRAEEVRALELLAYTMAKERGITRQLIKQNLDRWAFEGFHVPRGTDVESRATRAQLIIDGLLAYDDDKKGTNDEEAVERS